VATVSVALNALSEVTMTDRSHSDLNAKVRATVDDAIAEFLMMGMQSRSAAAALMAIQAMIRIEDEREIESVMRFAAGLRDLNE
jgi:hypothetical protein